MALIKINRKAVLSAMLSIFLKIDWRFSFTTLVARICMAMGISLSFAVTVLLLSMRL